MAKEKSVDENRKRQSDEERILNAVTSDVEKIYFNGFTNTIGLGDILITLEQNGSPVGVLNTSYTVAKTLAIKLADLIGQLEAATGNKIMTTILERFLGMEPFLQVRIRCELAEMKSMSIYLFVTQNALSPLEPFFHSAFIIEHLSFHFVKNRFRKVRNYR